MTVDEIAKVVHGVNKAICECAGDFSQVAWESAEPWQRQSAVEGVEWRINNPGANAEDQHNKWWIDKREAGWSYGPVKDAELKTHPCMVPYNKLPFEQRVKDSVFAAIVNELK